MSIELTSLTLVVLFTSLMWMPFIANVVSIRGVGQALGYPESPAPLDAWANRVDRAHRNAVDNLMIFAPLVLVLQLGGISNDATMLACMVYVVSRVVHFFALVFAIPVIKSLSFMLAAVCQVVLAIAILAA